ncbi:MAG TPA: hypothetical protein DCX07_05435 [Phycisphaerales bacterium]|nr:hypothetical protein [Phycisphaerales bacterium]
MIKLWTICQNTFIQTLRQPVFLVILLLTFAVLVISLPLSGWTVSTDYHETDQKMLENLGLATLMISGLFVAAFSASSVLSREIEEKTALTVISKPVPRSTFVLGKFLGVAGAVALEFALCAIVFLLTIRHKVMPAAADPYDWPVIVLGIAALAAALMIAVGGNLFFGWAFTSGFTWCLTATLSAAFTVVLFVGKGWVQVPPGYDQPPEPTPNTVQVQLVRNYPVESFRKSADLSGYVLQPPREGAPGLVLSVPPGRSLDAALEQVAGWSGVQQVDKVMPDPVISLLLLLGMLLGFMAVLIFVAVAVAVSTRFGQVVTLLICAGVFLFGMAYRFIASEWLDRLVVLRPLTWMIPDLRFFRPMEAMTRGRSFPLLYVATSAGYCLCFVGAILAAGMAMFQTRQLQADSASSSTPGAVGLLAWIGRLAAVLTALAALEGPLGWIYGHYDAAFHSLVPPWTGVLLVPAGLLWLLWGFFARGARWSWWTVLMLVGAAVVAGLVAVLVPSIRQALEQRGYTSAAMLIRLVVAAGVLTVLLLPKTRQHFRAA